MVSEKKALAEGYELTPDSQEVKMIDPKLTIFATPESYVRRSWTATALLILE